MSHLIRVYTVCDSHKINIQQLMLLENIRTTIQLMEERSGSVGSVSLSVEGLFEPNRRRSHLLCH